MGRIIKKYPSKREEKSAMCDMFTFIVTRTKNQIYVFTLKLVILAKPWQKKRNHLSRANVIFVTRGDTIIF